MVSPISNILTSKGNLGWWFLQITGWLFAAYLLYAQCIPALNYELGVRMGTQEPASQVSEIGVAYWWAFAFADLVVYAPILVIGLIGHAIGKAWSRIPLAAALGMTIYWPMVSLAAVTAARAAPNWSLSNEGQYWIVLPLITLWAAWGLWYLMTTDPCAS